MANNNKTKPKIANPLQQSSVGKMFAGVNQPTIPSFGQNLQFPTPSPTGAPTTPQVPSFATPAPQARAIQGPQLPPQMPQPTPQAGGGLSTQQQFILSNYGPGVYQETFGTPAPGATQPGIPTTPTTPAVTPQVATGGAGLPQVEPSAPETPSEPTQPTPPQIPPETQDAQKAALDAFLLAQKISPGELTTQEDIDNLIVSTKKAFTDISDQPIPMGFITGQMASVEKRALNLLEPLQRKLARLQAKRTANLEASKFALERADKAVEDAGEVEDVETAPDFTLGEGQVRFDAQGNVIASNIGAEGLSGGFGGSGYVQGENPTVDSWVNLINSGQSTIANVPADLKNAVANALTAGGSVETDNVKAQILQDKIDTIINLIDHPGMAKSVGPTGIARFTPFKVDTLTGEVQDFVAGVHQLTAKETLDYLINLKSQGGTLGALNQSELDILKESASKINDWEIKDKNGNPTGKWNVSEDMFKAELERLGELTQRALLRATGGGGEVGVGDAVAELEDDIGTIGESLGTREALIDRLVESYPEFDRDFIASKVYTLIPDR